MMFGNLLIIFKHTYCYNPPQYLPSFTSIFPVCLPTDISTQQLFLFLKGCLGNALSKTVEILVMVVGVNPIGRD